MGACAAGLALGSVGACNAVTGLDKFEKVECVDCEYDAGLTDEGSAPDTADVVDASAEEVIAPPPEAGPDVSFPDVSPTELQRHWARWRVEPPAKQGDGGSGDAASWDYQLVDGGAVVLDVNTKLHWEQGLGVSMRYEEAKTYCKELQLLGRKWSVPTRMELESLLYPEADPLHDPIFATTYDEFWTMSAGSGPLAAKQWTVHFETGSVALRDVNTSVRVRCVSVP
jgi:hypothetical protein